MKKISLLCIPICVSILSMGVTKAAEPGIYAGAGVGKSSSQYSSSIIGRVYTGYSFNEYLGIESGYSAFPMSRYHANRKYRMQVLDVVAKAYYPLGNSGFDTYILGGVAGVNKKDVLRHANAKSANRVQPKFGAGASQNVTKRFTTGLEYSRIQGRANMQNSQRAIPNENTLSINFTYNFD